MNEAAATLPVHTLLEARCLLMVTTCEKCAGPLEEQAGTLRWEADVLIVAAECRQCATPHVYRLRVSSLHQRHQLPTVLPPVDDDAQINATHEPSAALDVWDWITLSSILLERARTAELAAELAAERTAVRQLRIAASKSLAEALKFYRAGNELPPRNALFHKRSREVFHEHPEWFARRRLIEQRAALPTVPPTRS